MGVRKKATTPKPAETTPQTKPPKSLIPDDRWVGGTIVDVLGSADRNGQPMTAIEIELSQPRAYVGRVVYFRLHPGAVKTVEFLAKEFPGVNFFDTDDVWNKLGNQHVRAHVFIEPERTDPETHQIYKPRNRVASIYQSRRKA